MIVVRDVGDILDQLDLLLSRASRPMNVGEEREIRARLDGLRERVGRMCNYAAEELVRRHNQREAERFNSRVVPTQCPPSSGFGGYGPALNDRGVA